MPTRTLALLPLVCLPLFSLACSIQSDTAEEEEEVFATDEGALTGGSYASAGQFPSTLFITILPGFKSFCTAAKVGPRHILTAGHCVWKASTRSYFLKAGDSIAVSNAATVDRGSGIGTVVKIKRVIAHPSWVQNGGNWVSEPLPADLGLIEVESGLTSFPTAPISVAKVQPGTPVTLQGYGCEGGLGSGSGAFVRKKYDASRTVSATDAFAGVQPYPNQAPLSRLDDTYFFTRGKAYASTEASLCPGDSGGPIYRSVSGRLYVAGVNSYYAFSSKDPAVAANNWFVRVDSADDNRNDTGSWLAAQGVKIGHY